jgi:hypothetical protein
MLPVDLLMKCDHPLLVFFAIISIVITGLIIGWRYIRKYKSLKIAILLTIVLSISVVILMYLLSINDNSSTSALGLLVVPGFIIMVAVFGMVILWPLIAIILHLLNKS